MTFAVVIHRSLHNWQYSCQHNISNDHELHDWSILRKQNKLVKLSLAILLNKILNCVILHNCIATHAKYSICNFCNRLMWCNLSYSLFSAAWSASLCSSRFFLSGLNHHWWHLSSRPSLLQLGWKVFRILFVQNRHYNSMRDHMQVPPLIS